MMSIRGLAGRTSPPATTRRVSTQTIDAGSVGPFARDLLDFAEDACSDAPERTFRLPNLRLTVACRSEGFLEMCARAIVDAPAYDTPSAGQMRVSVVDGVSSPSMPTAQWPADVLSPIPILRDGLADTGLEGAYDIQLGLWHFAEPVAGRGVQAMRAPGAVPPWESSFPLRDFIHWALQHRGWRLIHAGTLAIDGKGVLIIGPGGSGKSGTTLAGIMAGMASVGDDYIAISLDDGKCTAYPLMKLMKQDARGLRRVGVDLERFAAGRPNWQNKYELDFEELGRGPRATSIELTGILFPRISDRPRSSFEPMSSRSAMMALAPSNLQQLPGGWRQGMSFTAELARRLPAFALTLSSDATEIAGTVERFIEEMRR